MVMLSKSSPIVLLCGVLIGGYFFKSLSQKNRLVFYFLISFLILDIISRNLMQWFRVESNLFLFSCAAFLEFILFTILYTKYFITKQVPYLYQSLILIGTLLLVHLIGLTIKIDLKQFELFDRLLVDAIIMTLGMIHLYQTLGKLEKCIKAEQKLNVIILLYFTVDFFISLTINFMVNNDRSLVIYFWIVRLLFLIILYSFLILEIWKNGKQQKSKQFG